MIQIRALSKDYRGTPVLADVDVDLPRGEITFLMGRNGAGKTTVIKAMLDLEPYRGTVSYDGRPLSHAYGRVGVVFDDAPLYRRLTGYQNIRVLCARRVDAETISARAGGLLSDRELRRRAGSYSYGQRKKLALAVALLGEPEYLLLDEVANGLDHESMEWLKRELKRLSPTTIILLTGHQFDFYDAIVDRVLVLRDGRVRLAPLPDGPSRRLGVLYETALQDARG